MNKLLGLKQSRITERTTDVKCTAGTMRGLTGRQLVVWIGGGFIAALVVFYLIANWDYIGNGFLCFAEDVAGMKKHYHFPMRDGGAYTCKSNGVTGDGNK